MVLPLELLLNVGLILGHNQSIVGKLTFLLDQDSHDEQKSCHNKMIQRQIEADDQALLLDFASKLKMNC